MKKVLSKSFLSKKKSSALKKKANPKIVLSTQIAFVSASEKDIEDLYIETQHLFSCREEIIRDLSENMCQGLLKDNYVTITLSKFGYNAMPNEWEREISDELTPTLVALLDIFVGAVASAISPKHYLEFCGPQKKGMFVTGYDGTVLVYKTLRPELYLQTPYYVSYFLGAARLCVALAKTSFGVKLASNAKVQEMATKAIEARSAITRKNAAIKLIQTLSEIIPKKIHFNEAYLPTAPEHYKGLLFLSDERRYSAVGNASSISSTWEGLYDQIDTSDTGFSTFAFSVSSSQTRSKTKGSHLLY